MLNPFRRKAAPSVNDNEPTAAKAPATQPSRLAGMSIGALLAAGPDDLATADSNLMNLAAGLNTEIDKRSFSFYGYGAPNLENWRLIVDAAVRGSWLARRIVNTIPEDMLREGWTRTWDNYEDDTSRDALLAEVEKAAKLDAKLMEGTTWGRQYGGAGCLIVVEGQEKLQLPLDVTRVQKGQRVMLQPFDRWDMNQIGGLTENDLFSPFYGEPEFFTITNAQQYIPAVHRSRVLLFEGNHLSRRSWRENGYWHDSVLASAMASVKNYDTATGGIASLIFEANVDILTIPGLAEEIASGPKGIARLRARFASSMMMKSLNRVLLLDGGKVGAPKDMTREEKFSQRQISFAGVIEAVRAFMSDVAGAADMPITRLFGQSPAGMDATGDSDLQNYYDHIKARQKRDLLPQLEYLYEILCRAAFGEKPPGFTITFNPLWQMSDGEQATANYQRAQMGQILIQTGVASRGAIARDIRQRKILLGFTDKDVAMAEEQDENEKALAAAEAENATAEAAARAAAGTGNPGGNEETPAPAAA